MKKIAVLLLLVLVPSVFAVETKEIQLKSSWDYPPIWETDNDGISKASITLARGKFGNCLELGFELNPAGGGWAAGKTKAMGSYALNTPFVFLLKSESVAVLEIRFVDTDGSVFIKKIGLKGSYKNWTQVVLYINNFEYVSGGDNKFGALKEVYFVVYGIGSGKILIDEVGYGPKGAKATFQPAGPVLDPNRNKSGIGFEQRRNEVLIPEDAGILEWMRNIQDFSSPEKSLLPSMEDSVARTYDNALAAMVFILKNERGRAERILDVFAGSVIRANEDPGLQNFFLKNKPAGFYQTVFLSSAPYRGITNFGRSQRDMAWLLMAYKHYEKAYNSQKYSEITNLLREFIVSLYKAGAVPEGNTESDLACSAALRLCGESEYAGAADKRVFKTLGKQNNLPLVLYALCVLSNGKSYEELLDIPDFDLRYRKTLDINGTKVSGFFSSADELSANVRLDGTGQMASAYYAAGNVERGNFFANQLDAFLLERNTKRGVFKFLPYTANSEGGYDWIDTKAGSLASAAWYVFAKEQFNPMSLERSKVKVKLKGIAGEFKDFVISASSSKNAMNPAQNIMDGNMSTGWSSGAGEIQWISIDLKKSRAVTGITFFWGDAYAKSFSILFSDDGKKWKTVFENNDGDGRSDEVYLKNRKTRFVKIGMKENALSGGYALKEIDLKEPGDEPDCEASAENGDAPLALDGSRETAWKSPAGEGRWFEMTFPQQREMGGMEILWGAEFSGNYSVTISTNGKRWNEVFTTFNGNGGKDTAYFEKARVKFLKILLRDAAACEIKEITLKGGDEAATPQRIFEAAAAESPSGYYSGWLNKRQVYWAITGADSGANETLVSEDGDIEPYEGSYSISPFIYRGNSLITARNVAVTHGLEKGYLPMPSVVWNTGDLQLSLKVFSSGIPGNSVTYAWYTLQNTSSGTVKCKFITAIRPYQVNPSWQSGGVSEIQTIRYGAPTDSDPAYVFVNGNKAVVSFTKPVSFGAQKFSDGDISGQIANGLCPSDKEIFDEKGLASGALVFDADLPQGEKSEYFFMLTYPVEGIGENHFPDEGQKISDFMERRYRESAAMWDLRIERVKISIPDKRILNALKSSLLNILINKDEERLLTGPRNDQRSVTRDCLYICEALLRMGYTKEVKDYINWLCSNQADNGRIPPVIERHKPLDKAEGMSEYGSQYDFISMIMEYYRFSKDREFIFNKLPFMLKAMKYAADMEIEQDDHLILKGLKDTIEMTDVLGKPEAAVLIREKLSHIPDRVLNEAIRKYYEEHFLPLVSGSRKEALSIDGLRFADEFIVLGDEEKAWKILDYFTDAMRPEEWNHVPERLFADYRKPQNTGDMPNSAVGANLIIAFRDMLVKESGNRLILGQGIKDEWFKQPCEVSVKNAPTYFGAVSYQVNESSEALNIEVSGKAKPSEGFVFKLPHGLKTGVVMINDIEVPVNGREIEFMSLPARITVKY